MARSDGFSGLSEFLAVARHASFRAAAAELGVTPAAVSQAIRTLESKTGLVLFQRTTRHVGLTEAGESLLARVRPAAAEIADAFDALTDLRDRPAGLLRLSVPRVAVPLVIEPVLADFRRAYPDVSVDVDVDDGTVDLTANNLDAGVRIGEMVERDMIAVRLTPDLKWCVLGAPSYFAARGRPRTPEELTRHECIRYRFLTAGSIYRWEFERGGREFSVDVPGGVTVNDGSLMLSLAVRGMGLIYTADAFAAREVAAGQLEPTLEQFLPTTPGLFLYFPARTQTQPKLRAFIDMLTASQRRDTGRAAVASAEARESEVMIIRRATSADCEVLLDRWLRSVQATHTFVSPADIEEMTPQVRTYLSSDAEIWAACDDAGTVLGFMGLSEGRIDSMFLAPEFMGRGVGRQMVRHAQSQWADLTVDVNEQNEAATRFYEACGFVVTGRSELDEQGRPYPLLHMKLIAPTLVRPPERRR